MYPTKMEPKKPPSQIYQGVTASGLRDTIADVFITKFNTSKQINPTVKLSNDPINGPPVCLPNLVFNIACTGSIAPVSNVRNISKYFIGKILAVS
jgi:hypothetical protein